MDLLETNLCIMFGVVGMYLGFYNHVLCGYIAYYFFFLLPQIAILIFHFNFLCVYFHYPLSRLDLRIHGEDK